MYKLLEICWVKGSRGLRNIAILHVYFLYIAENHLFMGASKTFAFTKRQNQIAIIMKALGHPARIAIVDYLTKINNAISDDIASELPLSQPTVTQHLQELKRSGLIKGVFRENRIYYSIDKLVFSKIDHYYKDMTKKMEKSEKSSKLRE